MDSISYISIPNYPLHHVSKIHGIRFSNIEICTETFHLSHVTHRAFCDALTEESAKNQNNQPPNPPQDQVQAQNQTTRKLNSESEPKVQKKNSSSPPPPKSKEVPSSLTSVQSGPSQSTGVISSSTLPIQTPEIEERAGPAQPDPLSLGSHGPWVELD
ncbi:hypothetical protein L484_013968 [Morus notabilis]|uniref:BIRD-IDD transcription factor fourth C2HC zinc finger domain-containing protein n=1 Tax=Morus notabilis TaxID=981085 RepID=W9QV64_9ROSA|nr:hypothetical protein L484_013968 [Morus notabilis]